MTQEATLERSVQPTQETIISADSHMLEPGDLWTSRVDAKFRDRAPRIFFDERRHQWFFGTENVTLLPVTPFTAADMTGDEMRAINQGEKHPLESARKGGWDPAERLKDMALDGVSAEVLYTSFGFNLFQIEDAALQQECFRVYNDWLAEFVSYDPKRFAGLALISCYDRDQAVAELDRVKKLGLNTAMIWASPPDDFAFTSTYHDPIWEAAQDLQMPISLHIGTGHGPESRFSKGIKGLQVMMVTGEVQRSIAAIIFSGVLERFPRLTIVSAENDIGWLAYFLQRADWAFDFKMVRGRDPHLSLKPSEYFKRQCYATFMEDRVGLKNLDVIGADRVMWSSDYPHASATWPQSREVIARDFVGVSPDDRRKIVRDTAATMYGLAVE
ncbi:MAG TPA: amidohydrolase family protein [Dehalococcoidia bacterium]|nr:amidohydrolase family protein [Dehalococcoidia bacterium]